jgi:hypothetical protein
MIISIIMVLINIGLSIKNYKIGNIWVSGFCASAALSITMLEISKHY